MQQCRAHSGAFAAGSLPLQRRTAAFSSRSAPLTPQLGQQRAAVRLVAARAEQEESSSAAAPAAEEPLAAEQLLARRRKPAKAAPAKAGAAQAAGSKQGPTVIAPVRDQVYGGGPQTPIQRAENTVVSLLAILFFVILIEGVFLAGSGFMSEGLDQFAQDVVFPAFSPTLGLFLAISTAYGVWKTREAPPENQ